MGELRNLVHQHHGMSSYEKILFSVFGKYMDSAPPPAGIMGATLEIQRAQRIEAIEQQLMRREVMQQ